MDNPAAVFSTKAAAAAATTTARTMESTSSPAPTSAVSAAPPKPVPVASNKQHSAKVEAANGTAMAHLPSTGQTPPVTPRPVKLRFPVRIGITWQKGERLEAQDFSNTWYPSKIVEISEAEMAVLIHFEGWNQRYDEWFEMTSDRLRPTTRHSERKDKGIAKRRRVNPHPIYRAGDEVLAKWKDCKRYPAKISRPMGESTYEVIFYDGVTHLIQAINILPMPEEMKAMKVKAAPPQPKAKLSFKQVKLNLPASIRSKQEKRSQALSNKILARKKKSPPQRVPGSKLVPKVKIRRDRELDVFCVASSSRPTLPPKSLNKEPSQVTVTCEATLSTVSEAECLQLFGSAAMTGVGAAGSGGSAASPGSVGSSTTTGAVAVQKVGAAAAGSAAAGLIPSKGSRTNKRAHTDTSLEDPYQQPRSRKKKRMRARASSDLDAAKKDAKLHLVKKSPAPHFGSTERSKSLDLPGNLGTLPAIAPFPPQIFVPSKAFIVEEDHNPFKCPYEGCTKDFRKENLLQYHIKYYHTEAEPTTSIPATAGSSATTTAVSSSSTLPAMPLSQLTARTVSAITPGATSSVAATPVSGGAAALSFVQTGSASAAPALSSTPSKRRRRKTDSICSTDSEMSASSKSKSSKRQRNDSEISVTSESPDVAGREHQTDAHRLLQNLIAEQQKQQEVVGDYLALPDTEEADEEEMASDLINCSCGLSHTAGLMIQCEVCLCWQHFKCADVKKTGKPPTNYVCLICENPKGVRESCKHLHDLGWERRGELPTYPFKQAQSSGTGSSQLTNLACECNDLLATLQGIKRALHSTRRQIKISKEEEDPEFQLWQTDWDNWTKPEEDLTLTPRSPDASAAAASSFLFPTPSSSSATLELKPGISDLSSAAVMTSGSVRTASGPANNLSTLFPSLPLTLFPPSSESSVSSLSPPLLPVRPATWSQSFSVSMTPPKASERTASSAPAPGSKEHGPAIPACRPTLAPPPLPPVTATASVTATATMVASSPLTINTSATMSTEAAPSPASSLTSSHMSGTPPQMLSPVGPPQTPSVGRAASLLPSIVGQPGTDGLIKDLFPPGPAGDASASVLANNSANTQKPSDSTGPPRSNSDTEVSETKEIQGEAVSSQTATITDGPPKGNYSCSGKESQDVSNTPQSSGGDGAASSEAKQLSEATTSPEVVPDNHFSIDTTNSTTALPDGVENQIRDHKEDTISKFEDREKLDRGKSELVDRWDKARSAIPTEPSSDGIQNSLPPSASPLANGSEDSEEVRHQNGDVSPPHASSSVYADVNGRVGRSSSLFTEDDEDTLDNDTDTAEESADPYRNCEHNLLVHVKQVHTDVEQQLEDLEERIMEMENSEHNNPTIKLSEENILNDVPALKKSLSKLARYLLKVRNLSS